MLALDLFNTRFEKNLQEGALDDTITRTQAHLMEPLSKRAAEIRTELRSGKLRPMQIQQLEREYEDLVDKRMKILKGEITSQEECMGYGSLGEDDMIPVGRMQPGTPEYAAARNRSVKYAELTPDYTGGHKSVSPTRVGYRKTAPAQMKDINPDEVVNSSLGEAGPRPEDVPAYLRKQQGQPPLTPGQVKAPRPDTLSDPRNLNKNIGNRNEIEEQGSRSTVAQDTFNEIVAAWQVELDYITLPFPDGRNATLTRPQIWNAIVTLSQVNPNKRISYVEQKFKDFDTFMRWASQLKRYKVPPKKKKNAQPGLNLQPTTLNTSAPQGAMQSQTTPGMEQPSTDQGVGQPRSMGEARGQKKNPEKEQPDLTGTTAQDAVVQRELQKVRARHPAARSDIEALIKDEIVNQERIDKELGRLETTDSQQDAQLKQALTLNRQQEQEINNLNQELSQLDSKLNQVLSTVSKPAAQPTKSAEPETVATTTPAQAKSSPSLYVPAPMATQPTKTAEPDANKSAAEIARLEKQIQQLELMMTLKSPAQQDDLRDRIDALEKERDAKVEKQRATTAKAAATRKAGKEKAAATVASQRATKSKEPETEKPTKTAYYPNTADIPAMGGSPKSVVKTGDQRTQDILANIVGGIRSQYLEPEVDQEETNKIDPKQVQQQLALVPKTDKGDLEQSQEKLAAESTDNPLDAGAGKQLSRTPEIRRLRQQKDYELMLKKELANRIQDRDRDEDEHNYQDVDENKLSEIDIARQDLEHMTGRQFHEEYGMTKQEWRLAHQAELRKMQPPAPPVDIMSMPDDDLDQVKTRPTFDRTGRMIKRKPVNTQQGMRRMMGTPKNTRPAPALEPVQVTMQVPNRKTDQYDLLPAKIFNSEAEAREFARRVNGQITSIKPVMHETYGQAGSVPRLGKDTVARHGLLGPVTVLRVDGNSAFVKDRFGTETRVGVGTLVPLRDQTPLKKRANMGEGFQDFKKPEPYAVCLAGKPVKRFDFYEQARQFHDNWKKKLYREGNKEKADKITLMPVMDEAANPAQQAAIAINMKKHHVKPKHVDEDTIPGKMVMQGFVIEYDPATKIVTISKRGQELFRYRYNGQPSLLSFQRNVGYRINQLEDDLYGREDEPGVVSLSRIKVPGQGHGYQTLGEDATENRSAAEDSIFKRILVKHRGLIREFGRDKVVQAVESVVYNIGDLGNISEGDVGTWVHQVEQILGAE